MKKPLSDKLASLLFSTVFFSTAAFSFSSSPENTENYTPADWTNSQSAENDAKNAIKNNDLRLLGFAGRSASVPGVDSSDAQRYTDKCGIRYFAEFGDVVKGNNQLIEMKQASDYAKKYNATILGTCTDD